MTNSISIFLGMTTSLFIAVIGTASASQKVETETSIGIANGLLSVEFDKTNGALVSLKNLLTHDELLKDHDGGGNPFRIYLQPKELPPIADSPFPWHGKMLHDSDTLGGQILDAKNCTLIKSSFEQYDGVGVLTLLLQDKVKNLEFELDICLPDQDDAFDLSLKIHNIGETPQQIMTAFPYITGLGLGRDRNTNLAVEMQRSGIPGAPAWVDELKEYGRISGGVYGKHVLMQMISVYEPAMDEGLGVIVMDENLRNKLIHRFAPSGMSVLYFPTETLSPNQEIIYPTARILIHKGNWRYVARRYGEWFSHAFKLRKPAECFHEMDLYAGLWIGDAKAIAKNKEKIQGHSKSDNMAPIDESSPFTKPHPESFTSYSELPMIYLGNYLDIIEWAMYWQGIVPNDIHEVDGTYHFRSDLGGAPAMQEGVKLLHKIGRRIMFYIASVSVRKDSDLFNGTRLEDWICMEKPGKMFDIGYPEGVSMCFGYKPWQDHVAQTCKRILQESGADGIRLDEFGGPNYTCYNPVHHHESPYDGIKWGLEFLRKAREAMDEVNPDAILMTESHWDMTHLYTDAGGLQMFYPGKGEIDAMQVAIPLSIGAGYHPGQIESALNGYPANRTDACRGDFPGGNRPEDYPKDGGPKLRWHELRDTFRKAQVEGTITDIDPIAINNPDWVGRIWQTQLYWLLIGGHQYASPLKESALVKLPQLPEDIQCAYEIDTQTLEMRQAELTRNKDGIFITMNSAFGAVLLPTKDCPPLILIKNLPSSLKSGDSIEINLTGFSPWSGSIPRQVRVEIPGLDVKSSEISLPGKVNVTVPKITWLGNYYLKVTGDCLPLKRWIEIK